MAALSPWMWLVGYALLIALTVTFFNPILLLILVFGGFELYRRWQARNTPESRAFHAVSTRTRVIVAAVYLGLVVALAIGIDVSYLHKSLRI